MGLNSKDERSLILKANNLLNDYHARIMIEDASEQIISFYEDHQHAIDGDVVVVRTKDDETAASQKRNNCDKVLFVFGDSYWLTSYFSGVCARLDLPKALIKRANKALAESALTKAEKSGIEKFSTVGIGINPYPQHTKFFEAWEKGFVKARKGL